MSSAALRLLLASTACFLSACSSPQISKRAINKSDPHSVALVAASQQAHGGEAFDEVRDVSVRYTGLWASIGPRLQPVLSDTAFRRSSEERLLIGPRIIAQEHSGSAGKKLVVRGRGNVSVIYNGRPSTNDEARRAAALVADAYTMFLLGPFYFDRPGIVLAPNGEAVVDKAACDGVLAALRPGFGFSEEDRVILFIDRATRRLRRVRMTLNGLESTRGAEVEVTFRDFRKIGGILWPTDFDELIRAPFNLHAHRWQMLGLDLNRGLRQSDFTMAGFTGRATKPAAPLSGQ